MIFKPLQECYNLILNTSKGLNLYHTWARLNLFFLVFILFKSFYHQQNFFSKIKEKWLKIGEKSNTIQASKEIWRKKFQKKFDNLILPGKALQNSLSIGYFDFASFQIIW